MRRPLEKAASALCPPRPYPSPHQADAWSLCSPQHVRGGASIYGLVALADRRRFEEGLGGTLGEREVRPIAPPDGRFLRFPGAPFA